MIKYVKGAVVVLIFSFLIYIPQIAQSAGIDDMIAETEGLTAPFGFHMPQIIHDIVSGEWSISFSGLLSQIQDLLFGELRMQLSFILRMTAAGILSAVVMHLFGEQARMKRFVCVLPVSLLAVKSFSFALSMTEEALSEMFLFVQALVPIAASAATVSGSLSGGGAAWMFSAMQVFMHLMKSAILPLATVITLLSACDGLGEVGYLKGILSFLEKLFRWTTGLLLFFYGATAGLKTGSCALLDGLAGKTVKYAVGNFVPFIGNALAESLETVTTGAKTVRGALGIGGVVGICFVAAMPLIKLAALTLAYQLSGAFISLCGEEKTVAVVLGIGKGMVRMLGILISSAVMFIISVAMLCFMGGAV